MTLSELKAIAASDSASSNPRRRKAGEWAAKAVDAMKKKDWNGAIIAVANAIVAQPETYVEAFTLLYVTRLGSMTSEAKKESSRANGKKGGNHGHLGAEFGRLGAAFGKLGGRPRKYPQGWRNVPRPSTRKPGETRGRKPKNPPAETGAE